MAECRSQVRGWGLFRREDLRGCFTLEDAAAWSPFRGSRSSGRVLEPRVPGRAQGAVSMGTRVRECVHVYVLECTRVCDGSLRENVEAEGGAPGSGGDLQGLVGSCLVLSPLPVGGALPPLQPNAQTQRRALPSLGRGGRGGRRWAAASPSLLACRGLTSGSLVTLNTGPQPPGPASHLYLAAAVRATCFLGAPGGRRLLVGASQGVCLLSARLQGVRVSEGLRCPPGVRSGLGGPVRSAPGARRRAR